MNSFEINSNAGPQEMMITPLERLGIQISMRRKQAGYSAIAFAALINIDIETLAAIEFGYATIEEVNIYLKRITTGLGIREESLIKFLNQLHPCVIV